MAMVFKSRHLAFYFGLSLVFAPTLSFAADSPDRVALVIGNAKYPDDAYPLKEPVNDARDLTAELRSDGFDVEIGENLVHEKMARALLRLFEKIKPGSVTLVFFSGYGLQVSKHNYLLPTSAEIWTEADVLREGFDLEAIVEEIRSRGGKTQIVLLDAARSNPFERRLREVAAGLAPASLPADTLAMYSAGIGNLTNEAESGHSLFFTELLKNISMPDQTAEDSFVRTSAQVKLISKGTQAPWMVSSLTTSFSFGLNAAQGPVAPILGHAAYQNSTPELAAHDDEQPLNSSPPIVSAPPVNPSGTSVTSPEEALWQKLVSSEDRSAIELFVRTYPSSRHFTEANAKLASIQNSQPDANEYFTFREETVVREGPGPEFANRFTLVADQELKGLGQVSEAKFGDLHYGKKTWTKVVASNGNEGFVLRQDLLSPPELDEHKKSLEKREIVSNFFDRAERGSGIFSEHAAVWYPNGTCVSPGWMKVNLGIAFNFRSLGWSEGNTWNLANLGAASLMTYNVEPYKTITLDKFGAVQFFRFTPTVSGQTEIMGFKDDRMWYEQPDGKFGSYLRCGSSKEEKPKVLEMIDDLDEASAGSVRYFQANPEKRKQIQEQVKEIAAKANKG